MTKRKHDKRIIRDRMKHTGEPYMEARRKLMEAYMIGTEAEKADLRERQRAEQQAEFARQDKNGEWGLFKPTEIETLTEESILRYQRVDGTYLEGRQLAVEGVEEGRIFRQLNWGHEFMAADIEGFCGGPLAGLFRVVKANWCPSSQDRFENTRCGCVYPRNNEEGLGELRFYFRCGFPGNLNKDQKPFKMSKADLVQAFSARRLSTLFEMLDGEATVSFFPESTNGSQGCELLIIFDQPMRHEFTKREAAKKLLEQMGLPLGSVNVAIGQTDTLVVLGTAGSRPKDQPDSIEGYPIEYRIRERAVAAGS